METIEVNGVKIYPFESSKRLIDFINTSKGILVAINAEKILHANEQTRQIINRNIGYTDGIGAVWALKRKGVEHIHRIPGCDLWLDIINEFQDSRTFYLIGGKQDVIEKTVEKLRQHFPRINIVNYRNGYMNEADEIALIQDIVEKKPDVVFVAAGSPKQEILMEKMQKQHLAIYQGLGGSFDVYTNTVKRAPEWWRNNNLEWAYRLMKQPSRAVRQVHLITFFLKMLFNRY